MKDFSVKRAFWMVARTWPFYVIRLVVFSGLLYGLIRTFGFMLDSPFHSPLHPFSEEAWAAYPLARAIGQGLVYTAASWFCLFLLYLLKPAHAAAMVHLAGGQAPQKLRSLTGYGFGFIRRNFRQLVLLFIATSLVGVALRYLVSPILAVMFRLRPPDFPVYVFNINAVFLAYNFLSVVVRAVYGFIVMMIVAHAIKTGREISVAAARDVVILFAQNHWAFVKNGVFVTLVAYVVTILLIGVFAVPMLFGGGLAAAYVFWYGLVVVLAVKAALLEPLAIACMLQVFFKRTEGQTPDPVWQARLNAAAAFVRLKSD